MLYELLMSVTIHFKVYIHSWYRILFLLLWPDLTDQSGVDGKGNYLHSQFMVHMYSAELLIFFFLEKVENREQT